MAQYTLSNESITQMCEEVRNYLHTVEIDSKEQIRIVLSLEEILLRYQSKFGQDHICALRCGKEWGRSRITLTLLGDGCAPFTAGLDDDSESRILHHLLSNMGLEPTWQYSNGRNIVFWMLPKKKSSPLMRLALSIGLAIVLGLGSNLLPADVTVGLSTWVLTPLFQSFMGVLVGISGPLIFLSVAWGIYSIGDIATFGHIGKTMIGRFLLLTPLVSLVGNGWLLGLFPISNQTADLSLEAFSTIYQMLLDVIPGNIVAPFADNNPMQIIVLAITCGFSMLVLGKKTTTAANLLDQANFIVQYIMECISTLVPCFIFISVFNMFLNRQFQVFAIAYKPLLCMVGCSIVVIVCYGMWVSIQCKVPFFRFVKKLLPTFVIAVTTDSSAAAFPTNVATCEKRLGINTKVINLGLPLGQVIFMPGALILFFSMALSMAEIYQVDITPDWLLMAFLVTCLVSIAAPPIPGSPLTCYTLIFTQLGIPSEAVALAIVLNVLLGCLGTGINLYGLQCELTLLADQLDMLDKKILRS